MFSRFDIAILAPGMPFDAETLEKRSLGGSESAAIYMARALKREGARVNLFCGTERTGKDADGVHYFPAGAWPDFAKVTPHDVCIVQRAPDALANRTNARLNLLWCHDLALGRQERAFRAVLWNVDRVIVLSRFMAEQYKEVYGLDDEQMFLSRNGVDLELFEQLRRENLERDRNKLIYAARPERGLDVLLRDIMPRLLAKNENLRLYIAGYANRPPDWQSFYAECDELAARLGDCVIRLGCLSKRELYQHYLSAGLYVYPTPSPALPNFREVSCISAMECQAAGLPIVTSSNGALPETIAAGAGILVEPVKDETASSWASYGERFAEEALRLIGDEAGWIASSARGLACSSELDWSGIAKTWLAEFERLIRAHNDSPHRLLRHFWRTSDIVAAKEVLKKSGTSPSESRSPAELGATLLSPWSFMEERDGYRAQYEKIGSGHEDYVYEAAPQEPRFVHLEQWLRARTQRIQTLIDYGCAHGAYAIGLAQRLQHLRVHGIDIDHFSIEMAAQWATRRRVADRATFSVLPRCEAVKNAAAEADCSFDCGLLQEVLEHVPEPWRVLEDVERSVREGGLIYITVPFGPWEFTTYRTYPHRCHIWHFDEHDLRDMLGSKPELTIDVMYAGDNPISGEPQGWWIATYAADHRPVGPIDLERHLWLQRPRQTVSAAIIAGPGSEETLHWTLRSIQDVADEIVLADCGMSEEARRIAGQYDLRMIAGVNPTVEGFDRARNLALDVCTNDWCLWINTDERLVGTPAMERYLRENGYHGYAIRQHHFACDAPVPPDMPVRMFRRRAYERRTLRFHGAIHEHPEFAVNEGSGPTIALSDVTIAHVGYVSENVRRVRFARNLPLLALDQERYPNRLLQKYYIMRDTMHLVRYALEENGGRLNEAIRARCRDVIKLYREHFLPLKDRSTPDALLYYSEALEVLGEGFEAAFQVEADKTHAKTNGIRRYRFASTEDLAVELQRSASEKALRFDSHWW